jgi:signal transduction histidine kinase
MHLKFLLLTFFYINISSAAELSWSSTNNDTTIVSKLIKQSDSCLKKNILGNAVSYAKEALFLSRSLGYPEAEAKALLRISIINEKIGYPAQAIRYQKKAIVLYDSLGLMRNAAAAYIRLGVLEGRSKQEEAANESLNHALQLYEKLKDDQGYLHYERSMAQVYAANDHHRVALGHYLKVLSLEKDSLSAAHLSVLKEIVSTYLGIGALQKAIYYNKQGIKLAGHAGLAVQEQHFMLRAAAIQDSIGQKKEALRYYFEALDKAKKERLPVQEAEALVGIAHSFGLAQPGQSMDHLNKALSIAKRTQDKQLQAGIYRRMGDIYRQQNQFESALQAIDQHQALLAEQAKERRLNRDQVVKVNYELEQQELLFQQRKVANQRKIIEQNSWTIIGITVLALLTILWMYVYKTRQLHKKLAESNYIKDQLFSIIGHDLRTPIGGITQMLALMETEDLSTEQSEMVGLMKKQGERAGEILQSLLSWGKAQLKGITVKTIHFDPRPVILKNVELLHSQILDKELTIDNQVPAGISIKGDVDHFDFIIRNLISNAIKFSFPKGKITLLAYEMQHIGKMAFSIKDEGVGISEAQQLSFRTNQLQSTYGTEGEKGTGIGLSLSRKFVKANGGKIWLKSVVNKGATFSFSFPK